MAPASRPPVAPAPDKPADAGPRLVARIVDGLLIALITAVLDIPIIVLIVNHARALLHTKELETAAGTSRHVVLVDGSLMAYYALIIVVLLIVAGLYEGLQVPRRGQTVGKRLTAVRVVDVDDGGPPPFGRAVGRAVVGTLFSLIPVFDLVNALWLFWDTPDRQCLHDKVAGTRVVRA